MIGWFRRHRRVREMRSLLDTRERDLLILVVQRCYVEMGHATRLLASYQQVNATVGRSGLLPPDLSEAIVGDEAQGRVLLGFTAARMDLANVLRALDADVPADEVDE